MVDQLKKQEKKLSEIAEEIRMACKSPAGRKVDILELFNLYKNLQAEVIKNSPMFIRTVQLNDNFMLCESAGRFKILYSEGRNIESTEEIASFRDGHFAVKFLSDHMEDLTGISF